MDRFGNIEGEIPDGLAVVGVYSGFRVANERALVVLSTDLPYWMFRAEGRYVLCVEARFSDTVKSEIEKYEAEHHAGLRRLALPDAEWRKLNLPAFAIYALVMLAFFVNQQRGSGILEASGALDANAVLRGGEWWRIVTALTLHADIGHLSANLLSGVFFVLFVNLGFGAGFGWVLVVLSGAMGNGFTALVYHPEPHLSLGASTAIFGALGLLVGDAIVAGMRHGNFYVFRNRVVPVVGGLALLALLGAGDFRTDTLAHLGGFISGISLGLPAARLLEWRRPGPLTERTLLFAALMIPAIAWTFAR
jgi:rhomboid protease GluP